MNRDEYRTARREARKVLRFAVAYLSATGEHSTLARTVDVAVYCTADRAFGDYLNAYRLSTRLRWFREGRRVSFA